METKSRFWKKVHRIIAEPLDEICPMLFRGFHDWTAEKAWGKEKPSHAESDS